MLNRITHFSCSFFIFTTLYAQELDIRIGEPAPLEPHSRLIGSDKDRVYLLDNNEFKDGKLGTLEGWSIAKLTREFSAPLDIPVTEDDKPRLVATSAHQGLVQIFYTTEKKEENKLVLHVARYDGTGKSLGVSELARRDRKADGHTGLFRVCNDSITHHTAILSLRLYSEDMFGRLLCAPDAHVIMIDGQGRTLYEKDVVLSESKIMNIESTGTDAKGTLYLAQWIRNEKADGFYFDIHIVSARGASKVSTAPLDNKTFYQRRAASLPKGRGYEAGCRFVQDVSGNTHLVYPYGDKDNERLEGVSLSSLSATGELTADKLYPMTVNYPPEAKVKGGPAIAFGHIQECAFLPDGKLNIYGVELFPQPARNGDNGLWGVTLDPASGLGAPWSCRVEREYGAQLNVPDPFLVKLMTLAGKHYILSNEMRDNIGKECGVMVPWKRVSVINDNSVPAFLRSFDGERFGPVMALGDLPPAKGLHYAVAGVLPDEEYILQVASQADMRFVQIKAGK